MSPEEITRKFDAFLDPKRINNAQAHFLKTQIDSTFRSLEKQSNPIIAKILKHVVTSVIATSNNTSNCIEMRQLLVDAVDKAMLEVYNNGGK
jgi:hypothetical protein